RFFQMDLTARLSLGRLSELLGDAALATDIENRQTGATYMAQVFLEGMSAEEAEEADAFAEGVNAYIAAVRARQLDPPTELQLAFGLLGARRPADLMHEWDRETVAATGATVLYGTSYETGDVGRAAAFDRIGGAFEGFPDQDLRRTGLMADIVNHYAPPNDSSSAAGWGLDTAGTTSAPIVDPNPPVRTLPLGGPRIERGMVDRLLRRLEHVDAMHHPNGHEGWGSNEWAVMGAATSDGRALLSGDGHLQLSVPALFWQFGLDTVVMGDGSDPLRLMGATIAALPMMGVGTNGHVAWTQTAYFADVTDWYSEVLVLDDEGLPRASTFRGEERALVRVDETFEINDVPELGSIGRTEVLSRFTTFDGRFISSIEGRTVTADEPLGPGESRVNLMGEWIVPADMDGDGEIRAISFYYGPFDGGTLLRAFRRFAGAETVEDYRQAMRHFIGYGGSMMAADTEGSVFYSAYHAVPCRDYLPRDPSTNVWVEGADPRRLLDGTQYGAWRIPLDAEGRVDEAAAAGGAPEACAVPFDQWPQALNPARQYVHNANNDPGNIATDNDIFDDPYYIGGPWIEGYRAARIEGRLQAAIASNTASLAEMQSIQGDHHSNLGEQWAEYLLEFIGAARDAAAGTPAAGSPEERMAALWTANQARFEEVETRMIDWRDGGFATPAGVDTFYHAATDGERVDSVATMLFAAWFPRFVQGVLEDEHIERSWSPAVTGDTYTMSTMLLFIRGRGPGNPGGLGSWNPATEESVFFDDASTTEVESSQEIGMRALVETLDWLSTDPSGAGEGGFGTTDMSEWRWGLRHQVRFESLLADFLADDPSLGALLDMFNITTERLPLAEGLAADDPRSALKWFPRPGDQFDIDAANPGLGGTRFTHGSGPVFRMVIALGPDGVEGQNVLPGGQSGLTDSPFFADQARDWLANRTSPMRYTPAEVVAGATGRERFAPGL
ncbi:MAG: penicillin acylase family protein, partial [Myxococcales bacterium]|nr:penicillin acylase family protein [Myxococcales bacterium]